MPALNSESNISFRPSKDILDFFWTLSDGNDEQRNQCAIKLVNMIESVKKDEEKQEVLKYCKERLIRGLSSGRKFARVGFSVALTQLLHHFKDTDASKLLETINEKLKIVKNEKMSKSELGGIYLGRALAYSAITKSGLADELKPDILQAMLEELLKLSEKKSYLKPVCNKIIEDMATQVSMEVFADRIWPRLRADLKKGWSSCSLGSLALLIACRTKFPEIVRKKFVKNNWGYPLLGEDNDEHLIRVIGEAPAPNRKIYLQGIIDQMLKKRDVVSIWNGIGDKLMQPVKRPEAQIQRHELALNMAAELINSSESTEQVLDLIVCPSLVKKVFHHIHKKNDPLAQAADRVFQTMMSKLEPSEIKDVLDKLWALNAENLVTSHNFGALVDNLPKTDCEDYSEDLLSIVKGSDKKSVLSVEEMKQLRQKEAALRQLHQLTCSMKFTSAQLQKSVLSLFLRLAFFEVKKKNKSVAHCDNIVNFEEESHLRKLCETLLFKSLDQLSTLCPENQSKSSHRSEYIDLLYHLGQYIVTLQQCGNIQTIKKWGNEVIEVWKHILEVSKRIKQTINPETEARDSAFLLLFLFLGFQSLSEAQTSLDLFQEVSACYQKSIAAKKESKESEPNWVEVLTEVLLQLLSLSSHLGRVVATMVFRALTPHLTPQSIQLIAEVLIPKSVHADDAGGVLVDAGDDDGEEEDEEGSDLLDEDVPDEESESDEEMEAEEEEEDGEEREENGDQVDEEFRQKVKEALGPAADDDSSEEEELPDLSDSEMFKLDEMLAEIFRQKKKAGSGKKGREEKKQQMANFRARALDLVEVLVKGDRCGDFLLDIMKPLLLLMLKLNQSDQQALSDRSRSLFHLIKGKLKTLTDKVHSAKEKTDFFQELLELAQKVSDGSQLREIALACHIMITLSKSSKEKKVASQCVKMLGESVTTAVSKKHSKVQVSFYTTVIEMKPTWYQDLAPHLIGLLQEYSVKTQGKVIACSVLTSLAKKKGNESQSEGRQWMEEAAGVVSRMITDLDKDDLKVMLTKELFSLALALTARKDVFSKCPFDEKVQQHILDLKSKLNTDLRRLANALIHAIAKNLPKESTEETKKKKKKRNGPSEEPPAKKKRKS